MCIRRTPIIKMGVICNFDTCTHWCFPAQILCRNFGENLEWKSRRILHLIRCRCGHRKLCVLLDAESCWAWFPNSPTDNHPYSVQRASLLWIRHEGGITSCVKSSGLPSKCSPKLWNTNGIKSLVTRLRVSTFALISAASKTEGEEVWK